MNIDYSRDLTASEKDATLTPATSTLEAFLELSTNPMYMSECKEFSEYETTVQVDFLTILPGISTTEQVLEILGLPEEPPLYAQDVWAYRDPGVNVTFAVGPDNVKRVESIVTSGDQHGPTLGQIIESYGCPDAIIGFRYVVHEQSEDYTNLRIIYLEGGVEFEFLYSLIDVQEVPFGIRYFAPGPFDVYLDKHVGSTDLSFVRPFDWDEVVRSGP
ncbi:MAG: hypothetical protein EPO32_03635 [Anaerolineae bacterium]|nr:MAG: hypothetical protein EPO32_03635 [Anaerolineae bacterium]